MTGVGELFGRARELQAKMAEIQRDLASRRFEGSAGAGMVTATCSGDLKILEIRIEPAFHASGDREMIQDLTAAAVNAALRNAQQSVQEELQRASGGLDLASLFPGTSAE